jgi:hypothetical protein
MKGRIRLSDSLIPQDALPDDREDFREAVELGVPMACFALTEGALESLSAGKTVAILDQFALYGNRLMMGYLILSHPKKVLGAFYSAFPEAPGHDPSMDLRGRRRGDDIQRECHQLLTSMVRHGQRCAMVLPERPEEADEDCREQLREWAREIEPGLRRLGDLFFPQEVLQAFRDYDVDHVVLCVDPLFVRVPYLALIGDQGSIVDEPWTMSIVTAATELARLSRRLSMRAGPAWPVSWMAPDREVNERLGGNDELRELVKLAQVSKFRDDSATVDRIISELSNGCWCHFRGHGCWTGAVDKSGIVMANGEVFSSKEYDRISGNAGFLFTAACMTGFGETVGVEAFGSLVDYDRAGLFGAVLTTWPIHGEAATITTSAFYDALRATENVAAALKHAAQTTRDILPHPHFWAAFSLVGGWDVANMIEWK